MIYQQKKLTQFLLPNQITTLLVDIPQACHIHYHMTSHFRSLSQLHHMYRVTLPVEIPQSFHLLYHHELILYHLMFLPIPPVDTPFYQPSINIQTLQVLQPILHRSLDLIKAQLCALQTILKAQTQQRFSFLHQLVHHFLISEMFHHQFFFFW